MPEPRIVLYDREQLAWAAGLWDGEGNICISNGKRAKFNGRRHQRLAMTMCQTERDVLDRFHSIIGKGTIYGPYKPNDPKYKRKPYAQWHLSTFEDIQYATCLLWQWLSRPKKQQIIDKFNAYFAYRALPPIPKGPRPKGVLTV